MFSYLTSTSSKQIGECWAVLIQWMYIFTTHTQSVREGYILSLFVILSCAPQPPPANLTWGGGAAKVVPVPPQVVRL